MTKRRPVLAQLRRGADHDGLLRKFLQARKCRDRIDNEVWIALELMEGFEQTVTRTGLGGDFQELIQLTRKAVVMPVAASIDHCD